METKVLPLPPQELDKQSVVRIDRWISVNSEEHKNKDPDIILTRKWMKIGFEEGILFLDTLGRIWGRGKDGRFYPYHFNIGKTFYGFRMAEKAAN